MTNFTVKKEKKTGLPGEKETKRSLHNNPKMSSADFLLYMLVSKSMFLKFCLHGKHAKTERMALYAKTSLRERLRFLARASW